MKVRPIPPLATARAFQCHEMFFSTTDLKGIILSGNDVFVRVSGFSRQELYGRPHNLIRHPDMPRAAFALLWSNLKQGLPFAGYVKNMAKDGAYYWVFVVAVPASDGRYLSVRFKPSSPLLGQLEALYRQMLAAENAALANGGKEAEAVAAGLAVATAALESLHFASYDQLAHTALNLEIKARDAQLRAEGTRLFPAALQGGQGQRARADLYALGVQTYDQVDGLFRQLDGFVDFNRGLQEKSAAVLGIAENFRLHALNVNITSQRSGPDGVGVGVVAGFLSDYSRQLTEATVELREHIAVMARLQLEMLLFFQAEAAAEAGAVDTAQIHLLEECFTASTAQVLAALVQLRESLPRLLDSHKTLTRAAMAIEMAQVGGLTEAARIPDGETLRSMFAEFRAKISSTRTNLDDLHGVMDKIGIISSQSPRQIAAINVATRRMQAGLAAITAAAVSAPAVPAAPAAPAPAADPEAEDVGAREDAGVAAEALAVS
ncbi:MAG: PAS domain-containing protein [Opitutales bacterium]|nr:PAS domain-containing protein [Opitutales bacterium]